MKKNIIFVLMLPLIFNACEAQEVDFEIEKEYTNNDVSEIDIIRRLFAEEKFEDNNETIANLFEAVDAGEWRALKPASLEEQARYESCLESTATQTADRWDRRDHKIEPASLIVGDWGDGERVGVAFGSNSAGFVRQNDLRYTIELTRCNLLFVEYAQPLKVNFQNDDAEFEHNGLYHDQYEEKSVYRINPKRKQIYRFMDDFPNHVEASEVSNKRDCISALSDKTQSVNIANVCAFDVTSGAIVEAFSYLAVYDYSQEAIQAYLQNDEPETDRRLLYLEQGERDGLVYRFSYKNETRRVFEPYKWTNVLSR